MRDDDLHLALRDKLRLSVDSGTATAAQMIELALLYWEPYHNEDEAILLLERVLQKEPDNSLAKLWLAYLFVYHRSVYQSGPESLSAAVNWLTEVVNSDPECAAAAEIVLYCALESLHPGSESASRKTRILEDSVKRRPEWVYNRYYLAVQYARAGQRQAALDQVRLASRNVSNPEDRDEANPARLRFEVSITGRLSHRIRERALQPFEERILREK